MEFALLLLGAFLMAFAVGASGFADALIASAIWLHLYPASETVPLVYLCALFVHLWSLSALIRAKVRIEWRRLWPFVIGGVLGTPVGLWLLQSLDPTPVRQLLGAALLIASIALAVLLLRAVRLGEALAPRVLAGRAPRVIAADAGIGTLAGVLGGLGGLSGVLPALWSGLRGWSPGVQRAVYQPFIVGMHLWALVALGFSSGVPGVAVTRFAWCLGPLVIGVLLGHAVYRRLNQVAFRFTVLALLMLSGLSLVW